MVEQVVVKDQHQEILVVVVEEVDILPEVVELEQEIVVELMIVAVLEMVGVIMVTLELVVHKDLVEVEVLALLVDHTVEIMEVLEVPDFNIQ